MMAGSTLSLFLLFAFLVVRRGEVSPATLRGIPPGGVKYLEYDKAIAVTCSPDDSSATVTNLKWYGPHEYRLGVSEPKIIMSRTEMPLEENGTSPRIYTQLSGDNLTLFVTSLKDIDTGVYNCTGSVDNITSHWSFELQAYVGLNVEADDKQTLVYGEVGKIECSVQAQPAPEIEWYFNNRYINPINVPKYEMTTDGLVVHNVEYSDAGMYKCVGTEVTQGATTAVQISVDVASRPVMTHPPFNTSGITYRNAHIIIMCSATGTPPPTYKWYLGTKDNSSGTDVVAVSSRFSISHTKGDLHIDNVRLHDEQWYWCEASNRAGKVYGKFYFEVEVFPMFPDHLNQNKTDTIIGNVVEMVCESEAKPNAKMSFQREGNSHPFINGYQPTDSRVYVYERPSPARLENQLIIPQQVVIRINDTSLNDTASYRCVAENSAGRNQTDMHIIIRHPPDYNLMTTELYTQCIWEDSPKNITALLSGYPQPSVSWARGDGRQITPDDGEYNIFFEPYRKNGRPDEWKASLEINWQTSKNGIHSVYKPTGSYAIQAYNAHGTMFETINVVEAEFPGRATSVTVGEITLHSITLAAELPVQNGCLKTLLFKILFKKNGTNDFSEVVMFPTAARNQMRLDGLARDTCYKISVYSVNKRGRGSIPYLLYVNTRQSSQLHTSMQTTSSNGIPDDEDETTSALETTTTGTSPVVSTQSLDYSFTCTFESGLCGWVQNTKDDFNWLRQRGSTSTSLTGPPSDHTTGSYSGYYMYIEASFRKISGEAAMLDYKFPSPVRGGCFSMYYHMYGAHIGMLKVVTSSAGGKKDTLWQKAGSQANKWLEMRFPVGAGTQMITIIGTYGISFRGDIAIDDIKYTTESCDQTTTKTPAGPINCTFDSGLCGWRQESDGVDSFDWTRQTGKTLSIETGPSDDHTVGGWYLFIEASSKYTGESATLTYTFTEPVKDGCLSIYYHMYGTDTGSLRIDSGETNSSMVKLWSLSGDQGNQWHHLNLPIQQLIKTVKITGVIGSSYKGDIAIDDITYTSSACPRVQQRLVYEALYPTNCSVLSNTVTREMVMSSASGHSDVIKKLCAGDCVLTDATTPELSCEGSRLVIRWPTKTTFDANTANVPRVLKNKITTRILWLDTKSFKIVISTNIPPTVYPTANKDGSPVKVVLTTGCINPTKRYNGDNNTCA